MQKPLELIQTTCSIPGLPGSEILAIAPLPGTELIAVDSNGELLYRLNLTTPEAAPEQIALQRAIPIKLSKHGYGFLRIWPPLTLCP